MWLRSWFLALSRQPALRQIATTSRVGRRAASRFVAGETLEDAIDVVRGLNARGLLGTVDHLGENVTNDEIARRSAQAYCAALARLQEEGLRCGISIKLTHLGLDLDDALCYRLLEEVVAEAQRRGRFVRIDMEGSAYTERTLRLYRQIRKAHDNVGVAIQAYLYRSEADVTRLIDEGIADLRICKGAYDEPPSIAFPQKADVDTNFVRLCERMLSAVGQQKGVYPAIATHDERIIRWVRAYAFHHRIPTEAFEFQMLYGVRRDLQQQLADEGYRVRIYVPYGTEWFPYFMRRLGERPANLAFLLRAILKG
ncbi:MAG: proline dehydrogenase [Anaerolineae bacterium]